MKRINFNQIKRMSLQFSNILDQLQTRQISLVGPMILQRHQGMTKLTPLLKKFAIHQSIKAVKKKIKIKSEVLFNRMSTETIKRIINDLEVYKPSSGEIPLQKNLILFYFALFLNY